MRPQEFDLFPNATILNWTESECKSWLTNHFIAWSPQTGGDLAALVRSPCYLSSSQIRSSAT